MPRTLPAALSLGRDMPGWPAHRWAAVRASEVWPLRRIRACGADWVAVHYRLARAGVAALCRRHGIGVMVWTVDGDRLIDEFLASGTADVLITNRPAYEHLAKALEVVGEKEEAAEWRAKARKIGRPVID